MILGKPLPFGGSFVAALHEALEAPHPGQGLSALQRAWPAFCLTAILVTHSVCWARFARASLGTYSLVALSWMFRHATIPWELRLAARVRTLLRHYGITHGRLVVDDTEKKRSKSAKQIASLHKLHDKDSGGCILGQRLLFLLLVTPKITLPVGFAFYMPVPELTAWYRQERWLKQQGEPAQQRPPKPAANRRYPSKQELALRLLQHGKAQHPTLTVRCIIADALYGSTAFLDGAAALFPGVQVISRCASAAVTKWRSSWAVRGCMSLPIALSASLLP
jgi:DDE superfamily endonuclease